METLHHITRISLTLVAILIVVPPIALAIADLFGWLKEWPDGDK